MHRVVILVALVHLAQSGFGATAPARSILNYSGKISVDGAPFSGLGYFVFTIQNTNGVILWASGDFPFEDKTNLPPKVLKLPVRAGTYSARLGDSVAGMPPLNLPALKAPEDPRLTVWFNDGIRGWKRIGENIQLAEALASHPGAITASEPGNLEVQALLKEFREFRAMYDRQHPQNQQQNQAAAASPAAPKTATVSIANSPSLGQTNAALVLVEFTDFQCPFCKQANDTVLPQLKTKYVDTGKLRVVMRNLALSFHPNAEPAARAGLCAHEQNQFWPMRDLLFAHNDSLNTSNFLKAAEQLKLNLPEFTACLASTNVASKIAQDGKDAADAGINGTPTFVLGKATGDKVTGTIIVGSRGLAASIDKMLAAAN